MRVLVTGSSGLIGSALVASLADAGDQVTRLRRAAPKRGNAHILWNPDRGEIDAAGLEGHDAVVHLAGESPAGRWTAAKKNRIRDSRVLGTRLLCETLARLERPPRALLSASAIGYYGDRGDEVLGEESEAGSGFLPDVCRAWEEATGPAAERGVRVVILRFGVVLSPQGGALAGMLAPFRMGLGGTVGSGKQFVSWIAIDDAVAAIRHILAVEALRGPVNVMSPDPVTNRDFTKTLGRVLGRPTVLPLPAVAARLVFGEMADEMLLASARALPEKLLESGYEFQFPDLEDALRHLLDEEG